MEEKISIIVPVYNAEKTLYKCVESLVLQKYKNIEIILINDKSTDNSNKICEKLANEYDFIKYIINEKNMGVSATRNIGLDNATGEYIVFVDSDDWVDYNYCEDLLSELKKNDVELVISGFWYHNDIKGLPPQKNIFGKEESIDIKSKNDVVELYSKWHFSALWNKIFIRDIIEKNKIRFDESISIGEDMRFGIDYVNCMDKDKIVVINKPLYHYIHINPNSLWYKHMNQIEISIDTMQYLFNILDDDAKRDKSNIHLYNKNLLYSYLNYFDFIIKNKDLDNKTKKDKIDEILSSNDYKACVDNCEFEDNEAKFESMCLSKDYNSWIKIKRQYILKENIYNKLVKTKNFINKVKGRLNREKNNKVIKKAADKLKNDNFSIISQNCTGGVFYHDMGMKFLSPTINLHFKADDFIKFVNNIENYLSQDLDMRYGEFYPVGKLCDIEIYFNHYNTCKEAVEKWNERKKRINFDKMAVIMTDRDEFNQEVFEEFKKVKYPKLLFTGNESYKFEDSIYYDEFREEGSIGDILSNKKFYKEDKLISLVNKL